MPLDLLTPLLDYRLAVIEEDGWRQRGRPGELHPLGVVAHHTANGERTKPTASLHSIINGRAGLSPLAGPLAQGYVDRLGRPHLVAAGRANHGGSGFSGTLIAARTGHPVPWYQAPHVDDGIDGNAWYLGIEVENDGVGEPYPDVVVQTLITMAAAWTDAFGWQTAGAIHHRQHTRRKVDMSLNLDLPRWVGIAIWTHHVPTPPGPEPVPTQPQPWRYENVNVKQFPVHVQLDDHGDGFGDAPCSISKVIGEPRMNGTLAVYNVSPTLRRETYGKDGVTRIEVQGGPPKGAVDFVVSAVD